MRTTLTLDDDLAAQLRDRALRERRSYKSVVNEALRAGLSAGRPAPDQQPALVIEASRRGFHPGIDVSRLNQLVDELDVERFGAQAHRGAS